MMLTDFDSGIEFEIHGSDLLEIRADYIGRVTMIVLTDSSIYSVRECPRHIVLSSAQEALQWNLFKNSLTLPRVIR